MKYAAVPCTRMSCPKWALLGKTAGVESYLVASACSPSPDL